MKNKFMTFLHPHVYPTKSNNYIKTRSSATAEIARDAEMVIQGHSTLSVPVVVPIDAAYLPVSTQQ